jgi:hypothetical protein
MAAIGGPAVAAAAWAAVTILGPWDMNTSLIGITIGICLLLYSAARLPAGPLLIGAMAGLVPVLVAETSIVAKHFQRDAA